MQRVRPGNPRPTGSGRRSRFLVAGAIAGTFVLAACGAPTADTTTGSAAPVAAPTRLHASFDLEAHRGGAALTTENSLAAYSRALDLGVSTLELDVQVTEDLHVIVSHDTRVNEANCRDTSPAVAGDPLYPYAGKPWRLLALAQVKTLQCGYQVDPAFPNQKAVVAPIPELADVFALLKKRGADDVSANVEIKSRADDLEVTVPRDVYAQRTWAVVSAAGMSDRVTIQSFDWESLKQVHAIAPKARLVALSSPDQLQVGSPGASPWLGGVDVDDVGGSLVRAAKTIDGVVAVSPQFTFPVDAAMVAQAHAAGLTVIPWTVDKPADMTRLIDLGVDGIITNHPDVLRKILQDKGIAVPEPHPAA
ncbi:MAG: glycerophosphodiester phosphodiesterase [Humibacillus sp.]|nr:glycerophosphodiester phosphodiesterase [Humibacillus sp.]MDN5776769.1 glycerophosphodiester phosphodiesterase [Humibacillus sp.]